MGQAGTVTNVATRKTQTYYDTLAEASAINNRSSIRYANVKANTDLEYVLNGNNVKENIIVKAAATSYVYSFTLTLSGLTPTLYPSGAIGLCDSKTGERQYVIPAPFMYDAKGALSEDVAYTLTPTTARGTYTLTVTADPDWINAEGRAFPVTIDPSICVDSLSADTYVSSEFPESCFGSGTSLSISSVDTVYVKFARPVLPVGASINTATLGLPVWQNMSVGSVSVSAHRVLSSWDEYTMSYDSKAGYSSTILGTATVSETDDPDDPVGVVVTGAVTAWLSGSPNYGIALVGDSYYYDDVVVLQSRELAIVDDIPPTGAKLIISYNATIPEGVYAFRNLYHDTDMWMTVENESFVAGAYLQQTDYSPFTATDFDNASFFKISHASDEYGTYIIRSMLNNNLTLSLDGSGRVVTKEIPSNDADVESSDTFYIEWSEDYGGYVISPYFAPYLYLGVNPDYGPYINTDYSDGTIYWELSQYTGNTVYGFSIEFSNSSLVVGQSVIATPIVYSTQIGANIPSISVSSGYTSQASGTWNPTSQELTLQLSDDGILSLTVSISNNSAVVYSENQTFRILPISEGVYYIQNAETKFFVEIESLSSTAGIALQQSIFHGELHSRWNIIHVSDGYFKIQSPYSDLYMGIDPTDPYLIAQYSTVSNRTLWRFEMTTSGNYAIICKGAEGSYNTLSAELPTSPSGDDLTALAYVDDNYYHDEWMLSILPVQVLATWNSTGTAVGYWNHNITIYSQKRDGNTAFVFDAGMNGAISQWDSALPISITQTNDASSADILAYGLTAEQYTSLTGNQWDKTAAGTAKYICTLMEHQLNEDSVILVCQMLSAKIFVLSREPNTANPSYYPENVVRNICTHELGHALGYFDHSPTLTDVMYTYVNGISILSPAEIQHLRQLYE